MKPQFVAAVLLAVGCHTIAAAPLPAQASPLAPSSGLGFIAGAGAGYEVYRFSEPEAANIETLSLLTIPLSARVALPRRTSLLVSGRYARGSLVRADGSEITISGPTDTELQLGIARGQGNLTSSVTAILVLPTGNATHSLAEAEVASVIASDLLPVRISHWGSGGGGGLNVGVARVFAGGNAGLSVSYIMAREYEPNDLFVYRPGNQLQVRGVVDRAVGSAGKATLSLGLEHFSDDALDGTNFFRPGIRYRAMGSYAFALRSRSTGVVYLGGVHRAAGDAIVDLFGGFPAQDLLLLGGGMRLPAGRGVLMPSADVRLFRSDDGLGQGSLLGVGAALEWPAGEVTLVPTLRARLGNVVVRTDSESTLTGLDIGLGIRYASPRQR
ncbi:hypothetical protein BH23GEM7_BH23GEM7_12080 [soil metagenome]|nr:hypothetical protein [Gemmatimonadota bacterium]